MTTAEQRFSDAYRLAARAGRRIHTMSGGTIDTEDATQQAILWLLEHEGRLARCYSEVGLNGERILSEVMTGLKTWVRGEVEQARHMDAAQQVYYNRANVEESLRMAWSDEVPQIVNESGIKGSKNAATAGAIRAVKADIKRALASCVSTRAEAILLARYGLDLTWDEVAASVGLAQRTVRDYASEAIDAIVDFLNGLYPVPDDGPGTRDTVDAQEGRRLADGLPVADNVQAAYFG